jgi:hypothetical protein
LRGAKRNSLNTLNPLAQRGSVVAEVRRQIERIIESDPTIRNGMFRGIINSRGLSRYILENFAVDSTMDAVLGVLRRYPLEDGKKEDHRLALKDCHLSMKGGMAYLIVENSSDIMRRVADFAATIRSTRGDTFRVVVSSDSVRIVAGQAALDNFKQTFRPKEIIRYSTRLAEVSLLLPHGPENLGSIATAVTSQLTLNGIDPVSVFVCPPEDIMIVSESDASRTFEALQQLLKDEIKGPSRKSPGLKNTSMPKLEMILAIAERDDSMMNPWIFGSFH